MSLQHYSLWPQGGNSPRDEYGKYRWWYIIHPWKRIEFWHVLQHEDNHARHRLGAWLKW
jgi:hypothetical protein